MTPEIALDILLRPTRHDSCLHVYHLLSRVLASGIPGAIVELGCRVGHTSRLIRRTLDYYGESQREFHVYDSFDLGGFEPPSPEDAGYDVVQLSHAFCEGSEVLTRNFHGLELPTIHAGWFRDTLPQELPDQIAYAYLDSDLYAPMAQSLEAVYPRLAPGAICHLDDCGGYASDWPNPFPGVGIAARRFLAHRRERAIPLWADRCPQICFTKIPLKFEVGHFQRVLVTGPQRCGTRITSRMFAQDAGEDWTWVGEEEFGTDDVQRFRQLITAEKIVVHCPAVMQVVPEVADEETLVVVLHRPLDEVVRSRQRIDWNENANELAKYQVAEGDSALVKWREFDRRRHEVPHVLDVDFHELAGHPLFLPSRSRTDFLPLQTEL